MSLKILSRSETAKGWGTLARYTIEQRGQVHTRDVYELGDAAIVLLYDAARGTVILIRQPRLAVQIRGLSPYIIEACAGMLDGEEEPGVAAIREAEEETGHRIGSAEHVFSVFPSPGGLSQQLHCFMAPYSAATRVSDGGGLEVEGEEIEVLELGFDDAFARIGREIIDAHTIILLQHLKLSGRMG